MNRIDVRSFVSGLVGVLAGVVIGAAGMSRAAPGEPKVVDSVRAHRFVVVDDKGASWGTFGVDKGGAHMILYSGKAASPSIGLDASRDGRLALLLTRGPKNGVLLECADTRGPGLTMYAPNKYINLGMASDAEIGLVLSDDAMDRGLMAAVDVDKQQVLVHMHGKDGTRDIGTK